MNDQRTKRSRKDLRGYLCQLPALALLDRLPTPMLGIGPHGDIDYANPACAEMLGYVDGAAVTHQPLPTLLTGHEARSPIDCLGTLQAAAAVVEWNHHHDYVIRTMVSTPLLFNETDALLLIGVTDVTAWLWETNRIADVKRLTGQGSTRCRETHGQPRQAEGHGASRQSDRLGPW